MKAKELKRITRSAKKSPVKSPSKTKPSDKLSTYDELSPEEQEKTAQRMCQELVFWILGQEALFAGHKSKDLDIVVESDGRNAPSVLDLQDRYPRISAANFPPSIKNYPAKYEAASEHGNPVEYQLHLSKAIPASVFENGGMGSSESLHYSYAHYYLLELMLRLLKTQFKYFVGYLNLSQASHFPTPLNAPNIERRTVINLKKVLEALTAVRGDHTGIRVPDLFAFNPLLANPSADRDIFDTATQKKAAKPVKVWAYMFSDATSASFSQALANIIERKIKEGQFELQEIKSYEIDGHTKSQMDLEQWLSQIPDVDTKKRMGIAQQILKPKSKDLKPEVPVTYSPGEVMLIFHALEQSRIFMPGAKDYKKSLALSLLTGKSALVYLNKQHLIKEGKIDFSKLFSFNDGGGSKDTVLKMITRLQEQLDKLKLDLK